MERFPFRRYSELQDVVADWGEDLANLTGRVFTEAYAQWDLKVSGPEGWWVDGPVLLKFDDTQLELGAICCEFSVSLDTYQLDLDATEGEGEPCTVGWKASPWTELERFRGQRLRSLKAVEGWWENEHKFKGLSFEFEDGAFCFFDAGDELGLTWAPLPNDPSLVWKLGHNF